MPLQHATSRDQPSLNVVHAAAPLRPRFQVTVQRNGITMALDAEPAWRHSQPTAVAIDIGGTKIAGCLVGADGSHTPPLYINHRSTDPATEPAWQAVRDLLDQLADNNIIGI